MQIKGWAVALTCYTQWTSLFKLVYICRDTVHAKVAQTWDKYKYSATKMTVLSQNYEM